MNDETAKILKTFQQYSDTFAQKNARALLPFYSFPALMVDRDEKPKVLSNPIIAVIGLSLAIRKLIKQGYDHSELHKLEVTQVRDNLAIVSGVATRHRENKDEFDKFGFTYTLRKMDNNWKIIAGALHKYDGFFSAKLNLED